MGYLPKIYNKIILLMALIFLLYGGMFLVSSIYDINKHIKQYHYLENKRINSLNKKEICNVFHCTAIKEGNNIYYFDKGEVVRKSALKTKNVHIFKNIYFEYHLMSLGYLLEENNYVFFKLFDDVDKQYTVIIATFPIIILIFIYVITSTVKEEQEEFIVSSAGNEALLANKAMINITENVHHELNTPLEVIDNKIEKIYRIINNFAEDPSCYKEEGLSLEYRKDKLKTIKSLEEDFNFIKTSSEQIYSVLEKMKGFKHLRYSNGNKSIKDIIDGSFKIVNISNSDFENKVDDKLIHFSLASSVLKNVDLLSIMLNHIKNSLEANASKIYIIKTDYGEKDDYSKKLLKIRIIDNGNGIPPSARKNIFKPNFSTKSIGDGIRGNGMYLNQHILRAAGGEIQLISSSSQGTTIELTLPIKIRN